MLKDGSVAIYRQIIQYFEIEIASGRLKKGERIDPIRSLAMQFKVNPNTIQRALGELERNNYITTDRTNGKFVTEDENSIKKLKRELGDKLLTDFLEGIKDLELDLEEVLENLRGKWR